MLQYETVVKESNDSAKGNGARVICITTINNSKKMIKKNPKHFQLRNLSEFKNLK